MVLMVSTSRHGCGAALTRGLGAFTVHRRCTLDHALLHPALGGLEIADYA